jgi:hypothetical protein
MLSSTSEVEALMAAGCLASLALNSVSNQVRAFYTDYCI